MNEYIYKSFSDKFESQKLRHDLLSNIRYPNDINFAIMDPTNVNGHLELSYVKNIYDNMCLKSETDEFYIPYKDLLMELLCAFDLEEIYAPDLLE